MNKYVYFFFLSLIGFIKFDYKHFKHFLFGWRARVKRLKKQRFERFKFRSSSQLVSGGDINNNNNNTQGNIQESHK